MKRLLRVLLARFLGLMKRQEEYLEDEPLREAGLLVVGRHTYGRPKIWSYEGSERKVTIGPFCSISPGVEIVTGGMHPTDWVSTFPFRISWNLEGAFRDGTPASDGQVVIGPDVWLGTSALVLSGVTIGPGAIVAARAVVASDVPPYAIVAGVPARVVRFRFGPDIIQKLLEIAWWDWDDERIRGLVPLLSSPRVDDFLNAAASSSGPRRPGDLRQIEEH
jgi:chloramphenicol O-acetyltransferase type B